MGWRRLEINGGTAQSKDSGWRLHLPPIKQGYADAQFDDYGAAGQSRRNYPWRPGARMRLRARFSHPATELHGTAGFGFWNAPYGDPTVRRPALPQAVWFFFASKPNNLPFAPPECGHGWFASALHPSPAHALLLAPLAPLWLLLNQWAGVRRRLWPATQQFLNIHHAPLDATLTDWHTYELAWLPLGCTFLVDGELVLQTTTSPAGPLGFVCWIDNQYLIATVNGRFRWGTIPIRQAQWLETDALTLY